MTVGDLKAKLEQYPDDMWVMIPNRNPECYFTAPEFITPLNVTVGVNEFDNCLFIDAYVEDEDEDFSR